MSNIKAFVSQVGWPVSQTQHITIYIDIYEYDARIKKAEFYQLWIITILSVEE